jgi:hypothetical protein
MNVTHIVGGSFWGNLLSALSISSNLRDGQDSADLVYSSDALVFSLSRPPAIIVPSQMTEGRRNWWYVSPYSLGMRILRPLPIPSQVAFLW